MRSVGYLAGLGSRAKATAPNPPDLRLASENESINGSISLAAIDRHQ
jgi:hypothetical protein